MLRMAVVNDGHFLFMQIFRMDDAFADSNVLCRINNL